MKICHKSTLLAFLQDNDLQAQKYSSQNFLVDENIVEKICIEAGICSEDLIVEVGSGPGALTEAFLEKNAAVIAIEKDPKLSSLLPRFSQDEKKLQVFTEDFLIFPLEKALQKALAPGKKAKFVANLPYHITTPILLKLLPLSHYFSDIVVMIQKEVALRLHLPKKPKDKDLLYFMLSFYGKINYAFSVSPSCFYPKPSVDSAIIHFSPSTPQECPDKDFLFKIIECSLQQRRKMLKSSLYSLFPSSSIESILSKLALNPLARPEDLSLEDFIRFTSALYWNKAQERNSK